MANGSHSCRIKIRFGCLGFFGDEFGWSVGISGDTLVVGAHKESGSAIGVDGPDDDLTPQSGAAYIFSVPAADLIFNNGFE